MVGRNKLKELVEYALSVSVADQTEVIFTVGDKNTTRYANNAIIQNISKDLMSIQVRSIFKAKDGGAKIGIASGNVSEKEAIKKVVENSNEIAKNQQIDPHFVSLSGPKEVKEVNGFSPDVEELTVKEKAEKIKEIVEFAKKEGLNASGIFETQVGEVAVGNSLGVFVYEKYTSATITSIVHSDTSSGFASKMSYRLSDLDPVAVGKTAIKKAIESQNPIEIEPGRYDVVLEEEAVADILSYLAYMGFGGKQYHEGESFVADNLGKKVFDEKITIFDDAFHPAGIPSSFDYEGYPKEQVLLVENGVVKNVVYDTYTANRYEKASTGHSSGSNIYGPLALNLVLVPGNATKEEIIKSTKKGILVTRFHYSNVQHYKKLNMTGMTKDGTFLIEDGEVKAPIKNLRFTQSIIEALSNVEMVGKDLKLVDAIGTHLAPALKIKSFNFTSKTEH